MTIVIGRPINGNVKFLMIDEDKFMLFQNEEEAEVFIKENELESDDWVFKNAEEEIGDKQKYEESLRYYKK